VTGREVSVLKVSVRLKCVRISRIACLLNLSPLKTVVSRTSRQTDETGDIHAQSNGSLPITRVSHVDLLQPKKPIIACVRAGFHPSEARPSAFYLACLEAPLDYSTQVTSALWFSQDISHLLRFVEDLRAPLQVKAITCCVEAISWCIDTVCLEEIACLPGTSANKTG